MNSTVPSSPAAPPAPTAPAPAPKRRSCLLYGCGGLLALVIVIAATVAITLWWIQRHIKPVVLSAKEKAAVEEKLKRLGVGDTSASTRAPTRALGAKAESPSAEAPAAASPKQEPDRTYVPGSKVLKLTERELNGLLNANTDLGQTVRLELARDAINAYLAVPIPKDFPVGGGKIFRARGRFRLSLGNGGAPVAMLEDVTVFGLGERQWVK